MSIHVVVLLVGRVSAHLGSTCLMPVCYDVSTYVVTSLELGYRHTPSRFVFVTIP
jgi:hypothetical protein